MTPNPTPPITNDLGNGYRLFISRRPGLYARGKCVCVDRKDGTCVGWFDDEEQARAAVVRDMGS